MRIAILALVCSLGLGLTACGDEKEKKPPAAKPETIPESRTPVPVQDEPPPPPEPEPEPESEPEEPHYRLDDSLRLNEIQLKGSHNSYHIAPGGSDPAWEYDLPPLADQMEKFGVRGFELDIHYYNGQFLVFHLPIWDQRSHCYHLEECLTQIREWSDAHPGHAPMFIFYELKDESDPEKVADHMEELEQVIKDNYPREKMFVPDDMTGELPDVQSAMRAHGWPALGKLRGKAIMVLHEFGLARHRYTLGSHGLWGRRMFVEAVDGSNRLAGIIALDDASVLEGKIKYYAALGFLVRTRADDLPTFGGNRWVKSAAAFRSGAHIVLTDYPEPYYIPDYNSNLPGGNPGRCNPVTGPEGCTANDVEDPALLTKVP